MRPDSMPQFGTIVGVENRVRAILGDEAFRSSPIQFLVLDLSKVDGVDFSAAEAFTRINRILGVRKVQMIMCGIANNSIVQKSLFNVGLLSDNDGVEFFDDLNSALEYCENSLLKAFYQRRDDMINTDNTQKYLDVPPPTKPLHSTETMFSSPRRHHLHSVATTTLQEHQDTTRHNQYQLHSQPLQLILLTFASVSSKDEAFWTRAVPYFHRFEYPAGATLYKRDDSPDGFYLLESGMLKAEYRMPQGTFSELIVAGTTCGELPFFGGTKRTSTTVAERDCVVWMMGEGDWEACQREDGELARELLKCGLGFTSERMEAVTKYMLTSG
jgi:SulP family sulfate permease